MVKGERLKLPSVPIRNVWPMENKYGKGSQLV